MAVAHLASPPRFHANGKFKILQVADLHFSVSQGECRDTGKSPCVGDVDTLSLMEKMLDEEKPDMVVFTGDQLNGQETSWDAKSVIAKVVGPVIDRKIPWTAIFGEQSAIRELYSNQLTLDDDCREPRLGNRKRSSGTDEVHANSTLFPGGAWPEGCGWSRKL